MNTNLTKLEYLSPTGFIGLWILVIGLIFTMIIFYFVFFKLNEDNYSYEDKERNYQKKEIQKREIARLYPKE